MNSLFVTIIAAIILMILVTIALAIGLLITGKSRLKKGCGFTPEQKKGDKEDKSCPLCGHQERCKKDEKNDNDS